MSDLISRQAVIKLIHESADDISKLVYGMVGPYDLAFKVGHLPSAEPERKKGRWTRPTRPNTYERFCSECQEKAWFCGKGDYDFCPNCGARMEE